MASALIFSLIALISIMITISPFMSYAETPLKGFEARLIHRDSPESPLYNPKATRANLLESARRRSIARQSYIKWLMSGKKWGSYISAPLGMDHGDYIMRYKIGTPPVDTFGIFDTGSTLIWLQCQPCEQCYNQSIPIFDPAKSDSYEKVMCGSIECNTTPDAYCPNPNGECQYKISYLDGSSTRGVIATETIMLEDDGLSGNINLTNMIFGCGHKNVEVFQGLNSPGIIGLSRESSSLIGQISFRHVSYCITSENNGNANGSLKIGRPAALITEDKTQTPLLSGKGGLYYLSLEGIGVDGTRLNISRSVFTMTPEGGGAVFMDSGTSYSMFPSEAFIALKQGIMDVLSDLHTVADVDGNFPVCYDDSRFRLNATPEVVLYFTGLEFPLSAGNTWDMNSQGHYCLAIRQSDATYTIFGLYQHRNVNVGYDLEKNITSFKYTNCQ